LIASDQDPPTDDNQLSQKAQRRRAPAAQFYHITHRQTRPGLLCSGGQSPLSSHRSVANLPRAVASCGEPIGYTGASGRYADPVRAQQPLGHQPTSRRAAAVLASWCSSSHLQLEARVGQGYPTAGNKERGPCAHKGKAARPSSGGESSQNLVGSHTPDNLTRAVLTWPKIVYADAAVGSPPARPPHHVSLGEKLAPTIDGIPVVGQLASGRHEKLSRPPDS
jgi:hypothetical protein